MCNCSRYWTWYFVALVGQYLGSYLLLMSVWYINSKRAISGHNFYCCSLLGDQGFTARRSYASAVLGVVILSVCPSVRHTPALWLIQRTYRQYFYTTWKGNPSSQMWFFVQLCSSWQDFNWLKASCSPSAIVELLVVFQRNQNKTTNRPMLLIDIVGWGRV